MTTYPSKAMPGPAHDYGLFNRHDYYSAALIKAMIGAAPPFMEYIAK
jgi:hypothetical protein